MTYNHAMQTATLLRNGLDTQNPALVQLLGLCPLLAVSTSAGSALGPGIAPLPVLVDPSHSTGDWRLVLALSRAAIAAGAHGLVVEVVASDADRSLLRSDAAQGVPPDVLGEITAAARGVVDA